MKASFRLPVLPALFLAFHPFAARATVAPASADATISSVSPSLNFGALPTLNVGGGARALLRFDLSTLPAGAVTKATLTLWLNKVGAPGSVDLAQVTGAWSEASVTNSTAPSSGAPFASGVPVAQGGSWVTVDVTSQVQGWVASPASNNGLVVSASASSPATAVFFDSKEAVGTSHAATLDIAVTPAAISLAYGSFSFTGPQTFLPLATVDLPTLGVISGLVHSSPFVIFQSSGTYVVEFEVNATSSGQPFALLLNGVTGAGQLATAAGGTASHTEIVNANAGDLLALYNLGSVTVPVNAASLTIRQIR